jgi:hypothetical protein
MSVRGSGTRPALDCVKVEGTTTKLGQQRYRAGADGGDMYNRLVDGFWGSNANVVLPV